jgi:hypothetical protein
MGLCGGTKGLALEEKKRQTKAHALCSFICVRAKRVEKTIWPP